MSLNPTLTIEAWQLCKSKTLSEDEAKRLSRMLWSREELAASLLLDPLVFDTYPDLRAALIKVAKASHAAAKTPRPQKGDAKMRRDLDVARTTALGNLIRAESERRSLTEGVHAALRTVARQGDGSGLAHGYQWWIAADAR